MTKRLLLLLASLTLLGTSSALAHPDYEYTVGTFQRADGANRTNDWLSVDKLNATTAAVGGRNGALLTTTQATTVTAPPTTRSCAADASACSFSTLVRPTAPTTGRCAVT